MSTLGPVSTLGLCQRWVHTHIESIPTLGPCPCWVLYPHWVHSPVESMPTLGPILMLGPSCTGSIPMLGPYPCWFHARIGCCIHTESMPTLGPYPHWVLYPHWVHSHVRSMTTLGPCPRWVHAHLSPSPAPHRQHLEHRLLQQGRSPALPHLPGQPQPRHLLLLQDHRPVRRLPGEPRLPILRPRGAQQYGHG